MSSQPSKRQRTGANLLWRVIERIESTEWGTDHAVAAARALLEPTVTRANERLFRSHHPTLVNAREVRLVRDGRSEFWVADTTAGPIDHLKAGDLNIHIVPHAVGPGHISVIQVCLQKRFDTCPLIHPREMLTQSQIKGIREMHPSCCGVEVWIGGRIMLLYEDESSLRSDHYSTIPSSPTVGGLSRGYKVLDIKPSTESVPAGSMLKDARGEHFALSLRLKFQDGVSKMTSVTHGFVHVPVPDSTFTNIISNPANWFLRAKRSLKYSGGKTPETSPAIIKTSAAMFSNSPIGKPVITALDEKKLGTVTETYDDPSWVLPYPKGYKADLCLITADEGKSLPQMVPAPGKPTITGWGSVEEALQDSPLFISAYRMKMMDDEEGWKSYKATSDVNFTKVRHNALAEGTMYLWDEDTVFGANVSLLWRNETIGDDDYNNIFYDASGYSGSILCQEARDGTTRAVVFQNFQRRLFLGATIEGKPGSQLELKMNYANHVVKGGFILPPEIMETEIECVSVAEKIQPGTYPRMSTSSRPSHDLAIRIVSE